MTAEVRLGRAVRRAVVVGQVEVGHAAVERPSQHGPLGLDRLPVAEVLPQAERDRREQEAADEARDAAADAARKAEVLAAQLRDAGG